MTTRAAGGPGVAALLGLVLSGGCGSGAPEPPAGPHTVTLHAHGLVDQAACDRLRAALEAHPGVTQVKVDPDGDVAIRVADGRAIRAAALIEAIAKAGFPAHEGGH